MKSNTTKKRREVDDGRIHRLWYLPNIWREASSLVTVRDLQKRLEDDGWKNTNHWDEVADWRKIEKAPYVFLCRAPLTFGHSQLVISSPKGTNQDEKDFFSLGSRIIERTIITFKQAFKVQKIHEDENFRSLAVFTRTKGKYIKTLILRSSASEKFCKEYKIHLVPYFKSHEDECVKRYRHLHGITTGDKGGLLAWLGERETEVDKLLELGPYKENEEILDYFANKGLKMVELAKKLCDLYNLMFNKTLQQMTYSPR
jgi:hypothetical protein